MEKWSLLISLLSFIIAALALTLTELRGPRIRLYSNREFQIFHDTFQPVSHNINNDNLGKIYCTGIAIPLTFINISSRTGIIAKIVLYINKKESEEKGYFMAWRSFLGIKDNFRVEKEGSFTLPINGRSSVSREILFKWFSAFQPNLKFTSGEYELLLFYWTKPNKKPKKIVKTFNISEEDENTLTKRIRDDSQLALRITLNGEQQRNIFIARKSLKEII